MIMNALSIIVRYSRNFSERKMKPFDIGFPEQVVLMYLSQHDGINQDAIAHHFMIDKGAIAKTIGKLEEKGHIEKSPNKENKRENLISLTSKGKSMLGLMNNVLEEWNDGMMDGLSREEIEQFNRIAEKIEANVLKIFNQNWSDTDAKAE
ncbi:DNA-binding transcriptional regulator, MarR family [Acetanaerobacterium elongatum]|uniref:DNA-binding transcriptional regulator, MarR family n=2 Tax=Acetanaerobacterium elongatum TaxID=258515 RepID=A0A1G9W4W2_9FIRM|nr:DNA-binding transcriptional regulator, MarR family [Acetanaerobacterium elongatum]